MAKSWTEWETSLNAGVNPMVLLGLAKENPKVVGQMLQKQGFFKGFMQTIFDAISSNKDAKTNKTTSNLAVSFEGEEFLFCMSRISPPSLNHVVDDDVLIAKPCLPFDELFPPLLIDPQPKS